MSDMKPVEVVNKFMERWNAHDIDSAAALIAPDFVYTTSILWSMGVKEMDRESFLKVVVQAFSHAFPDTRVDTTNTVAAGDQVVLEAVENGTMTRDIQWFKGVIIPANNRFYSVPYVYFFKVNSKGLISSLRIISDTWRFREQLGIPIEVMYPNSESTRKP
jgi:steroid delta-isomerase-like uncharacterized protein